MEYRQYWSDQIMKNQFQDIFDRLKNRKNQVASCSRSKRAAKLKRLLSYILAHREEIHEAVWQDFRKPPAEVDLSEIFVVTSEIRHVLDNLGIWMHKQRVKNPVPFSGSRSYIQYEPRGVCLIISPWNFPFNLAIGPLVSAVAAGNCIVLKPSEFSPSTSRFISKLVHECFDEDEVTVIEGDKQVAQSLLKLPFDHVFFTGSPAVGKRVMEAASHHLTSVTLELGGKSPVIIDETANLAGAAQKICWGKFMNAGQTCVAPDYVLIQEEKEMEFLSLLGREIENRYGKSPEQRLKNPDFARLIDDRHTRRLINLLEESQNQGAEVFFGGNYDPATHYIEPTVLRNITDDSPVMQEEIFGPLLPVIRYNKLDEAIACIDRNPNPLALYLFTRNRGNVQKINLHTRAGSSCINNVVVQFNQNHLPFGGVNQSGFGKTHGFYGFRAFSNERSVVMQGRFNPLKLVYPPYGKIADLTVKLLLRYF